MTAVAPAAVLVVEHDGAVGEPLVEQLTADGYPVRLALTAEHVRVLARGLSPRVVLLGDLDSPRGALELLAAIRGGDLSPSWPADLPVIVLGAPARQPDLLRAFDAGADDFLARPPGYLELRARLRALLARAGAPCARRLLEVGALAIDLDSHAARVRGCPVALRPLEYALLVHLAREPRRVCAKQELLHAVWCHPAPARTRTLDSHASRVRRKLRAADRGERWVVNVRGVGYRLL